MILLFLYIGRLKTKTNDIFIIAAPSVNPSVPRALVSNDPFPASLLFCGNMYGKTYLMVMSGIKKNKK